MVPARNSYLRFGVMVVIHEPLKTDKSNFISRAQAWLFSLRGKYFIYESLAVLLENVQAIYEKIQK